MASLVSYEIESDEENQEDNSLLDQSGSSKPLTLNVNTAPAIDETMIRSAGSKKIDLKDCKELMYNPKYEEVYTPQIGPANPKKTGPHIDKNHLTGHLEPAFVSEATFELQRKNFYAYGLANNPSDGASTEDKITKVR